MTPEERKKLHNHLVDALHCCVDTRCSDKDKLEMTEQEIRAALKVLSGIPASFQSAS